MANSEILISVIVTAFNIENYLPRCLDSLLRQSYKPLEIIVVDDGSSDGTPKICDSYAREHTGITAIHRENGGPSAARNTGLALAKGTYIGYVDGDDWVEPDMYRDMLKACLDKNAQIAVCTYRQVGEGAEEIHPTGNVIALTREETLELYISGHEQYHIYHSVWSKLFKREIMKDITFREGRKSEDIMYSTMALVKAAKCVFLDTPYYNYTVDRADSIMNSKLKERRFQDEIPFWKEQIAYLSENGFSELSEKAYYQFCRKMLFYYIDFRDRKMSGEAKELAELLKKEKETIRTVYQKSFVRAGDRIRMKLFLAFPRVYYGIVKLYDKTVIPLRQ